MGWGIYIGFFLADFEGSEIDESWKYFITGKLRHKWIGMNRYDNLLMTGMDPDSIIKIFMLSWGELHVDILMKTRC